MIMVKKLYRKLFTNYLQNTITKIIYIKKINKKFNCYPPPPTFSGSTSLSEIEIKWFRKCTTHEYIMWFRTDLI